MVPVMKTAVERAIRCGERGILSLLLGLQRDARVKEIRSALRAALLAT